MFYKTCKSIVSHNYMHTKGTEMIVFEQIQNFEKSVFVPVGCN